MRKTHDIRELLDLLLDSGVVLPERFQLLDCYTPFAVDYRYEEAERERVRLDRRRALADVEEVIAWVQGQVRG